MTPEERDRLTRNEVRIEVVGADVVAIKAAIDEVNARLRSIERTLSEARGGWRTMMLVGGAAAGLGASLAEIAATIFHK